MKTRDFCAAFMRELKAQGLQSGRTTIKKDEYKPTYYICHNDCRIISVTYTGRTEEYRVGKVSLYTCYNYKNKTWFVTDSKFDSTVHLVKVFSLSVGIS